jgi:hypothetical protein
MIGRLLGRDQRDERGTTLLELLVGMGLMMIFLATFTGAILMLNQTANHNEAVVSTSSDLNNAFLHLDKTVRYAASISNPDVSSTSGDWYVEYLTSSTGTSICTQLRVRTGIEQLQSRTWTLTSSGYTNLSSWTRLADNISNGNATTASSTPPVPFTLTASGGNVDIERLTVQLVTTSGNPPTSSQSTVTFAAVNSQTASQAASNSSTYASSVCNQVGRP